METPSIPYPGLNTQTKIIPKINRKWAARKGQKKEENQTRRFVHKKKKGAPRKNNMKSALFYPKKQQRNLYTKPRKQGEGGDLRGSFKIRATSLGLSGADLKDGQDGGDVTLLSSFQDQDD